MQYGNLIQPSSISLSAAGSEHWTLVRACPMLVSALAACVGWAGRTVSYCWPRESFSALRFLNSVSWQNFHCSLFIEIIVSEWYTLGQFSQQLQVEVLSLFFTWMIKLHGKGATSTFQFSWSRLSANFIMTSWFLNFNSQSNDHDICWIKWSIPALTAGCGAKFLLDIKVKVSNLQLFRVHTNVMAPHYPHTQCHEETIHDTALTTERTKSTK